MLELIFMVLIAHFLINIMIILTRYCEDEELPSKDILILTILFGDMFIISLSISIYLRNKSIKKLEDEDDSILEFCNSCHEYTPHIRTSSRVIRCEICGHGQWTSYDSNWKGVENEES